MDTSVTTQKILWLNKEFTFLSCYFIRTFLFKLHHNVVNRCSLFQLKILNQDDIINCAPSSFGGREVVCRRDFTSGHELRE